MRVFAAIEPPQEILEDLQKFQKKLGPYLPNYKESDEGNVSKDGESLKEPKSPWRMAGAEKMHLTLQFLGSDVNVHKVDEAKNALREAASKVEPFEIECRGFGAFPSAKFARVLWAGAESEGLGRCAREVRRELSGIGLKDSKPFNAHITIARAKYGQRVEFALNEFKDIKWSENNRWKVEGFSLIESVRGLGGYEYKKLEKFKIGKKG